MASLPPIISASETGDGFNAVGPPSQAPFVDDAKTLIETFRRPGWIDRPSWERAYEFLQLIIAELSESDSDAYAGTLFYEAARIFESELNDDEAAIVCLQAGYVCDPKSHRVIQMARRVFVRVERWSMVCTFIEAQARLALTNEKRGLALLELGEIFLFRFKRPAEALRCTRKAAHLLNDHVVARLLRDGIGSLCDLQSASSRASSDVYKIDRRMTVEENILGLLDGLFVGHASQLSAQFLLAEDYLDNHSGLIHCALQAHSFAGNWDAYHRSARRMVSQIHEAEYRALVNYSLCFSARTKAISGEVQAGYLDELTRSGIRCHYYEELRGLIALDEGDLVSAAEFSLKAAATAESPDWVFYYLEQGLFLKCCASGERTSEVGELAERVLALDASSAVGQWAIQQAMLAQKDWTGLKVWLEQMMASGGALTKALSTWRLALLLSTKLNQLPSAEALFSELWSAHPGSIAPLVCLIELKSRTSDESAANDLFYKYSACLVAQGIEDVGDCADLVALLATWFESVPAELPSVLYDDPLGYLLEPSELIGTDEQTRCFYRSMLARSDRMDDPNRRSSVLRFTSLLSEYLQPDEHEIALGHISAALDCKLSDIGCLHIGYRLCAHSKQSRRAADWATRIANACIADRHASEYFALAGYHVVGQSPEQGTELWSEALQRNPHNVSARLGLERLIAGNTNSGKDLEYYRLQSEQAPSTPQRLHYALMGQYAARGRDGKPPSKLLSGQGWLDKSGRRLCFFHEHRAGLRSFDDDACRSGLLGLVEGDMLRKDRLTYLNAIARSFERTGDSFNGYVSVKQALDLEPSNGEGLQWILTWILETADVEILSKHLDVLLDERADDDERGWLWSEAGRILRLAGHEEQAAQCYEASIKAMPESWLPIYHLRTVADKAGEPLRSAHLMLELATKLRANAMVSDVAMDASERFTSVGQNRDALKALLLAYTYQPNDESLLERLQTQAERLADWDTLVEALEIAVGTKSLSTAERVLKLVNTLSSRLSRNSQAIETLAHFAEQRQQPDLWQAVADYYVVEERWSDAVNSYARAHTLTSDLDLRRAIVFRLSAIYSGPLNDFDNARTWLETQLEANSGDVDILHCLADIERRSGHKHQERVALTRTISLTVDEDQKVRLRIRLAELDNEDNRHEIATERLRRAASEFSSSPAVNESLADALGKQNATDEQAALLEAALHMTTEPGDKRRLSEKLQETRRSERQWSANDTVRDALNLLLKDPLNQDAILSFAHACHGSGDLRHRQMGLIAQVLCSEYVDQGLPKIEITGLPKGQTKDQTVSGLGNLEVVSALNTLCSQLPSVYNTCPGVTPYLASNTNEYGLGSIQVGLVPQWCFFKQLDGVCVSNEIIDLAPALQTFLFDLASVYLKSDAIFLSRWTNDGLIEVVGSFNDSLGINPSAGITSTQSSGLKTRLQQRFEQVRPTDDVLNALSILTVHFRDLDDYLKQLRLRLWLSCVTNEADLFAAVRLLNTWSHTRSTVWRNQFQHILAGLIRAAARGLNLDNQIIVDGVN